MTGTEFGPGGLLVVEATNDGDAIRLEIFPDCSGPWIESWRMFGLGDNDEYWVYPAAAGRTPHGGRDRTTT